MPRPEHQTMDETHNFHASVLREYDIRGIVGETLSENDALGLGRCFGTTIIRKDGKTVVAGFDGRLSSPALHNALVTGLREAGCDVITAGIGPTPMVYFAAHHLKTDAAIVVTGSHNPPNYNGFKMVLKNKPFYGESIQMLGWQAARGDWDLAPQPGAVRFEDVSQAYVARLMQDFSDGRPLKVVWDAGNGSAGDMLKLLTQALPGEHTVLFGDIDGQFPNHHPDPTVDKNLQDLQKEVLKTKADLGIAFDGDGDRIGVVDEKGNVIRSDMLLALYAADVLKNHPKAIIIGDVKCSGALFSEVARLGGTPLMWKTGHSLIKAKMAETKSPLAGELSGHIFFADKYYGFDDALYCGVRLLNIIGASKKSLSELLAHLPNRLGTPEIRIDVDESKKFAITDALKTRLEKSFANDGYTFSDIDGIRIDGPEGWLLMRPSNTQNCLVARIEAQNPQILAVLRERLGDALRSEQLSLPISDNH